MGDPGRVSYRLLDSRQQDRNDDGHGDPEQIKDTEGIQNIEKWRGKGSKWHAMHPNTMKVNRIRGKLKLEGKRGTCHLCVQDVPTWAFVSQ